jgi:hypothetical protein
MTTLSTYKPLVVGDNNLISQKAGNLFIEVLEDAEVVVIKENHDIFTRFLN